MSALSVNTLPYRRNLAFFGHRDLLEQIDEHLRPRERDIVVRAVAIWGTGGIGKSQIALEYAQQKWLAGTNVISCVASETEAEIAKSFNDAACRLNLHIPWLLILDNVEDQKALHGNWPTSGNGSVLLTRRSKIMASAPPAVAIEVPTFTTAESCELIMNITNREISTVDEVLAAHELSDKIGGLALAIDIIAKRIKTSERFKTIRDFLPCYNQHRRALQQRPEIA